MTGSDAPVLTPEAVRDIGDLLEKIRLILASDPEKVGELARSWGRVAAAVQNQKQLVPPAIQDVEVHSEGETPRQMGFYRTEMNNGLAALYDAAHSVQDALSQAAPQLAALRRDVRFALGSAAATGAGAALSTVALPVGAVLGGLGAFGTIDRLASAVNGYDTYMIGLRNTLLDAQAKFEALDTRSSGRKGVVPDVPAIRPA